jgi:xanthine dehydrogenase small subunit
MSAYLRAATLGDAIEFRAAHPEYTVLAGGTDIFVAASSRPAPVGIIDIFGAEGLTGVSSGDSGSVIIGAATTYKEIMASAEVRETVPVLAEAAREIGALQIQARGTIGGNMATSSPVGDTLPVLLATDATVHLQSATGRRTLPYEEFVTGYRTTALAADELIVAIEIPGQPEGAVMNWRKVGTRRAQSISKVMFAGVARVHDGVIDHVRLAFGAVADRPIRVKNAENAAMGMRPGAETVRAVRAAITAKLRPIDDVRSTAAYRAKVAENIGARFIAGLSA